METYLFPVVIEPDEDAWMARIPDPKLEAEGAATWGKTRDLRRIQEVLQIVGLIEAALIELVTTLRV